MSGPAFLSAEEIRERLPGLTGLARWRVLASGNPDREEVQAALRIVAKLEAARA